MVKKATTISILIISILLVSLYVVTNTYAVIINVIDKDGASEIINNITIRDLLTDDDGYYNRYYYDVKTELDITPEQADILMESVPLNRALDTILKSIVDYRIHNKNKLTNEKLYDIIVSAVNEDDNIEYDLKNKIINKTQTYINDISNYIYGIEVKDVGVGAWYY